MHDQSNDICAALFLKTRAEHKPQDATTNPSLIATAAEKPEYASVVDDVLKQVRKDAGPAASDKDVAAKAFRPLEVAFGLKILEIIPGRVSTEVDARLSYDIDKSIAEARAIIALYDKVGISRDRILVKHSEDYRKANPTRVKDYVKP